VECKKQEELSKDTHSCGYQDQRDSCTGVTDEKVHDGKVLKNLVEGVLNNNHNIQIKSFLGDGAYDSNENFKYLKEEKRIQPVIKVKINSIISSTRIIRYVIEKLNFK
jgi:hypothetical protein